MTRFHHTMILAAVMLAGAVSLPAAPPHRSSALAKPSRPVADVAATGANAQFFVPDPKRPGKWLAKLWVKGFTGQPLGTGYQGNLLGVKGLLFQNGIPAAKLAAPQVKGNNIQNIVVASGRVTLTSLTPKGTILKADTITWYAAKNIVAASGNVFYRDGKTGVTGTFPRLYADTALKAIQSYPPATLKGSHR